MPKFVPRQRKHRVLARQAAAASPTVVDTNSNIEILPSVSQSEKEARRAQLKEKLRAQQPKISSKKQKRLDKYIENKLRKDENADYLRRLEKERERFDVGTKPGYASAKNLTSKKRRFDEYVNGQTRGLQDLNFGNFTVEDATASRDQASDKRSNTANNAYADESDVASEDSFEIEHQTAFDEVTAPPDVDAGWLARKAPLPQGTGLAKPLEVGPDGLPIIPSRPGQKKGKGGKSNLISESELSAQAPDDISWTGFDDSGPDIADSQSLPHDDVSSAAGSESNSERSENSTSAEDNRANSDDQSTEDQDNEDDSASETSSEEYTETSKIGIRTSAFKSWASQQLNQAIGHTPSFKPDGEGELLPAPLPLQTTATIETQDAEKPKLVNGLPEVKTKTTFRQIYSVQVARPESLQELRSQLPIIQREQEIMEAIHNNPVIVIKGETGSGKTTQLPQFLYEAGYGDPTGPMPGLIGITQPRRVAAVSMAKRVGEELGSHGSRVAHQIRFDSTVSSNTAIKFMTDGILLRELSEDLLLKKYSAIIIDEAHERSVNTDILIGMLSKIVPARMQKNKFNPDPRPLKLIIMSATLNISNFLHSKLFTVDQRPPVVEAAGRQHRVTTHFALRSRSDYAEEVVEKVKKAHRKLPRGGMLIFLTGQNEIRDVQSRLRQELVRSAARPVADRRPPRMHAAAREAPLEVEDIEFGFDAAGIGAEDEDDDFEILTHSDQEAEEHEFDISDVDDDEETKETKQTRLDHPHVESVNKDPYDAVHILPLYSQLPTKEQLRVFEPPPERSRLIVLATNVAETSLTIPGIRFVFDCGRSKERKYNLDTGVQSFEIDYISKASAQQRAGRAGRTGPGHCWRLYTSAVYERFFPEHSEPEILRTPAESVVLQVKGFKYPRPIIDFPFPTPPASQTLEKAEKLLKNLGALKSTGSITELGRQLSIYPLSPRLGRILATAISASSFTAQAIALVAGLAVSEIYINELAITATIDEDGEEGREEQNDAKQAYGRARAMLTRHDRFSDAMKLLTAVSMYIEATDKATFCKQYFLRPKAMSEVSLLVHQLRSIVLANNPGLQIPAIKDAKKLSTEQVKQLNSIVAAGYVDQIAVRWDCAPDPPVLAMKPRRAIDVPYLPLVPLSTSLSAELHEKAVFIHPSSILSRLSAKDVPQYIVYTRLQQAQSRTMTVNDAPKTRMFPLTMIDSSALGPLAADTAMLQYGKPIPKTKIEEVSGLPKRRICWVSTELRGGAGFGWNLPPTKVKQVLDVKSSSGWCVEQLL